MWLAARTVGDRARDAERFTVRVHVTLFYSESNGADDEEIRPVRRSALGQDGGDRFPVTLGEAVKIRLDASSGRLQVALIHHMLRT
jgi:hypothetical protein